MMSDLNKTYLYRITHIGNIPHILQNGITHSTSTKANPAFIPIGDPSLITTRSSFLLDNGRRLGEYIPFYFGVRTPMLYVIQNGYNMVACTSPENVVYCVSSVAKVIEHRLDFVFTDGHAVDSFSTQYGSNDIHRISELLDQNAIKAIYWRDERDLDLKRKKEAEFLVLGDIIPSAILGYYVYNQQAKEKMLSFGVKEEGVYIKSEFYF